MSTTTQPLPYLTLSSGPLDPAEIAAVNLDIFNPGQAGLAAIWRKGQGSTNPLYVVGNDVDLLAGWAATFPPDFLMAMPYLFAKDAIEHVAVTSKDIEIKIRGDALPFYVVGDSGIAAIDEWMCGAVTTLHAIALPAAS